MSIKRFNDFGKVNESMTETDEYLAFWSTGAFDVDPGYGESQGSEYQIFHSKEELMGTITEDNGYSPEEIDQVNNLRSGDVWKSNHYGTYHMILKTKEK